MRNVTSDLVKTVMIRKFFQMVFIGNDKKSLHIYTATILGASSKSISDDNDGDEFISDLADSEQFRMRFEFAVGSNDNNEVLSIEHKDLTSTEHGLLNEIDCVQKVWGEKCKILLDCQSELKSKIEKITGKTDDGENEQSKFRNITADLAKRKILWVEQKKNGIEEKLLRSLSIPGDCQTVDDAQEPNVRDGVALRKAYAISVPQDIELTKGMELVNWVQTTIEFKYAFDDTNLNYLIKKEIKDEDKTVYLAPDFTWYFSPIVKSFIENRNCMVEIKRGTRGGTETCSCPIQKTKRVFYSSDKYQNSIDAVPNKLTVNFHHWDEDEKINSRQKYRLSARDVLPTPRTFSEVSEISIFLDTSDEHNRGNRQFVLGVFISFALAFGIDSTRLAEVEKYFCPLTLLLSADVWWITFLTLFSLTLMNKPAKLSEEARKLMKWRKQLLKVSMGWVLFVFAVFRSPLFLVIVSECIQKIIGTVAGLFLAILIACHFCYLRKSKVNAKDSLWVDLFGEDIL